MFSAVDIRHDEYLKRRNELMTIRESSQSSYDKAILYLSTGGLVLSATFLEQIGKPFDLLTTLLINFTWLFLALSIISNVAGYFFAVKNMDIKLNNLDAAYKANEEITKADKNSIHKNLVEWSNVSSIMFFLIAFMIFTFFVVLIQKGA